MSTENDKNIKNDPTIKPKIEDSFDLIGLVLDYLAHWKWFILSLAVCAAVAYYYVSTIIPVYTVSASIYLDDNAATAKTQSMLGTGDMPMDLASIIDETEIEILRSRNNLIRIVDSLDLAYKYFHVGRVRDVPEYKCSAVLAELDSVSLRNLGAPIEILIDQDDEGYDIVTMSSYNGSSDRQVTRVKKLPVRLRLPQGTVTLRQSPFTKKMHGTEKIIIYNPSVVASGLSGSLSIYFAKNSGSILRLSLDTQLIEEGRDVLKVLVSFYNKQIIDDKNRSALQTEAFILDRLVMIAGELKDVENRLKDYREANNVINLEAQAGMNLSARNANESQLATIDAEREILGSLENQIRKQDSYNEIINVYDNAALRQGTDEYNATVRKYNEFRKTHGPGSELLKSLEGELNRQKTQLIGGIDAAKQEIATRRRAVTVLDARSSGQLAVQPTIDKGLNEIFREQQVKVNIYTFLLQKREEIALQKTLATPTARFIDNPSGYGPVMPRRMSYISMGLLIGLLIPAIILLLKRLLFPTFKDKGELERITKVPVLGEICANDTPESEIVIGESVSTPIAELFRLLRNNINFVKTVNVDKKAILITSSVSGEGKTFVALNLAMTYALTGKRIVVVGLDIRRPVLARVCGLDNSRGVTTFLSGQEADVTNLLHQSTYHPDLYVLPAGPIPPNPNELLMSDNMQKLFNQLRKEFDYIIIDSAPIGLVSDTFLIVSHTDLQIYVTRAGFSTQKSLRTLHEAINSDRLPNVYIVLNDVDVASSAYIYRRYGHYGTDSRNKYAYAYGYGNDERGRHKRRKKKWWKLGK